IGPVADQRHDTGAAERLPGGIAIYCDLFIDLARQAPVGSEIDEDRNTRCAQLRQPLLREWFDIFVSDDVGRLPWGGWNKRSRASCRQQGRTQGQPAPALTVALTGTGPPQCKPQKDGRAQPDSHAIGSGLTAKYP